jgi:hypothetical protein
MVGISQAEDVLRLRRTGAYHMGQRLPGTQAKLIPRSLANAGRCGSFKKHKTMTALNRIAAGKVRERDRLG